MSDKFKIRKQNQSSISTFLEDSAYILFVPGDCSWTYIIVFLEVYAICSCTVFKLPYSNLILFNSLYP